MLSARRLHEGFVCSASSGDDTNHTTARRRKDLLGARWELDTGLALIRVVADDGDVVARGTTKRTTVGGLVFDVGEDGTLGDGVEREDVADGEGGVLAGVDELARVHALVCDEGLGVVLEPVRLRIYEYCDQLCGCGVTRTLRKVTLARGAPAKNCQSSVHAVAMPSKHLPRPESWTISFTTPRMYPLRSACDGG